MDCEYTDKVDKILNEISWENMVAKDWAFSFTLSFKGLLHTLSNDNEDSIPVWRRYFTVACQGISVDKYQFIPMQSTPYPSTVPLIIELKFLSTGGNITPEEMSSVRNVAYR